VKSNAHRKPSLLGLRGLSVAMRRAILEKLSSSTLLETKAWLAEQGVKTSRSSLGNFRARMKADAEATGGTLRIPARLRLRIISTTLEETIVEVLPA
jgi:hypothetical protein